MLVSAMRADDSIIAITLEAHAERELAATFCAIELLDDHDDHLDYDPGHFPVSLAFLNRS